MELRRLLRRCAWAGVLAGVGFLSQSTANAQEGVALPPINAVGPAAAAALPNTPAPIVPPAVAPAPNGNPPARLPDAPPANAPAAEQPKPAAAPTACDACGGAAACGGSGGGDYWAKVPVVQPFPRPGFFPIPPGGPGYYTLEDDIHGEERKGPPKYPYPRFSIMPPSFADTNWSYLDKPDNKDHDYADCLKRIRLLGDDCMLLTLGGEFRARYNYEENSRLLNTGNLRQRGRDNNYSLFRARSYADLMVTNDVRFFVEGSYCASPDYLLPPLAVDRDHGDLQNAFVELRLFEDNDGSAWLRMGRQELLYGSQRLVSTLDWVNTRRTFDGVKAYYRSQDFDLDAFCTQLVVPNKDRFNSVDPNQVFAGLWGTYRPTKNQAIDAYYLFLDNTNPIGAFPVVTGGTRRLSGATTVNTVGARFVGDEDGFLWDVEAMFQFGGFYGESLFANAVTAGVGYQWTESDLKPMLWLYFDHASGDGTPGRGNNNTFNQLFPFGHYYFGFIDVVGRRNINDVSAYFTIWPEKWMFAQLQCHNFFLDSARDALYNAGGVPIRQDVTGRSGRSIGTELDLLMNFHLTNHSDVLFSYSYLAAGSFVRRTATTESARDNPQAFYVQYSYRW